MSPTIGPMMNASPALWQRLYWKKIQQQLHYSVHCPVSSARNYRPSFRENKPNTLVFIRYKPWFISWKNNTELSSEKCVF